MHRLRVYIDTSVIGGCFDKEFSIPSNRLLTKFIKGEMVAVVSELTMNELETAPNDVKKIMDRIEEKNKIVLALTEEVIELADKYVSEKVVPESMYADALHIALATVEKIDVVVSWNFKHIVNLNRIKGFNAVNLKEGYAIIEIRSPREVIDE